MIKVEVFCDGCDKPVRFTNRLMLGIAGQVHSHLHAIVPEAITGATRGMEIYHACSNACLQVIATQRGQTLSYMEEGDVIEIKPQEPKGFN